MEYRESFPWYLESPSYFPGTGCSFIVLNRLWPDKDKETFLSFLLTLSIEGIDLVQDLKACYAMKVFKLSWLVRKEHKKSIL